MRYKYRLKFEKIDKMKYIGHLDLQDIFQRAINQSEIDIAYSKGFNPHQLMSFACPLPLFHQGFCEYIDIELKSECSNEIFLTLNNFLPKSLRILGSQRLAENEKTSASIVSHGLYEIEFENEVDLEYILKLDKIEVEKKTKKHLSIADIREDIFWIKNNGNKVHLIVSAGSNKNLKLSYILDYAKKEKDFNVIQINRLDLFYMRENYYYNLMGEKWETAL